MSKVVGIYDARPPLREPNNLCIAELESLLEKARSGEIVGFVAVALYYDNLADYRLAGMVGGYSMLGALAVAQASLLETVRGLK